MSKNNKKLEIIESSPRHFIILDTGDGFTFEPGSFVVDLFGRLKMNQNTQSFYVHGFDVTSSAAIINVAEGSRGFVHRVETIARR